MRSLGRLIRNAIHFLVSNLIGFGMGLVASVVMARKLGPNDLGIFHQTQWFAGTISVCLSLGFMTSVTKFTAQLKSEGRIFEMKSLIRFVYRIELIIGLFSSLGLIIFATPIADHYFSKNESPLFSLAFIAITPGLLTAVLASAIEGAQTFRYLTLHSITITPLSLITKIVLLTQGYGLLGLFWANLVFALFNLGFYHFATHREGLLTITDMDKPPESPRWKRDLWAYMRSMVGIHFVDLVVWSRSENYFLGRFCQAAEIAYYNLAQNLLLRITGILPNLMWKLLLPLTSEHHGRADVEKLKKTYQMSLRYAAAISFPIITACYLASYELVVIFYSHDYAEAKNCFQILCFGIVLTSISQPSAASLYATNRHQFILRYGFILAVLNILLNFIWIPKHGATGAALSYSITTGLGAIGGFVFTYQTLGFPMPLASFGRCAIACLGMGCSILWVLNLPVSPFDILEPFRNFLQVTTGHDAEILFGARSIRVFSGLLLGTLAYGALLIAIAKPFEEDLRVLESLQKYLPKSILAPIIRFTRYRFKP